MRTNVDIIPLPPPFPKITSILSSPLFRVFIFREEIRRKLVRMQSICEIPQPRRLQWKINSDIESDIQAAAENIDRSVIYDEGAYLGSPERGFLLCTSLLIT